MSKIFEQVQPAVKKETIRVAAMTFAGVVLMWILFFVLHLTMPEQVPFDYRVFLGGIAGGLVAVLNFFFMGLTVQKVASSTSEDAARMSMRASYSRRMLLQMVWVVIAVAAPCFQFAAGIAPLFFPSCGIKLMGILKRN